MTNNKAKSQKWLIWNSGKKYRISVYVFIDVYLPFVSMKSELKENQ